jgi:hypothetical protein
MKNKQEGISLIITFFILTIVLAVVLSISIILYGEIKIIRNIGNSVIAFYAADSAVEKVLYYDRKVRPLQVGGDIPHRGLCYMCDQNNIYKCPENYSVSSLNCLNCTTTELSVNGCDPITCKNCKVSFDTILVAGEKNYHVDVIVSPNANNLLSDFVLKTTGTYQNIKRAIMLFQQTNE